MFNKTITVLLLASIPLAGQSHSERWEWNHMWGGGMFFGWMMWIWVAVIVVIAVWAIKFTSDKKYSEPEQLSDKTAMATLKTRLAKGEIDEDEYLKLKKLLES